MTDFLMSTLVAGDDTNAMVPTMQNVRDDTSSDSEENGPRKRRLPGKGKKSRHELFHSAVQELKGGGNTNFCFGVTAFIVAVAANVLGIFTPWDEIDATYRSFAIMAAVFMINQSFMFVKTIRDGEITSMKDGHGRISPEWHFLQGAMPEEVAPHRAVCFACLALSILAEAYGIMAMDAEKYTRIFISLSSLYVLSASLNLGWLLRDRFEAEVWAGEAKDRSIGSNKVELAVRNMVKTLSGMAQAMKLMFGFVGCMAIAITIYAIIDFGVKEKGVGLISAGMVFAVASAWSMAQAFNEESMQDTGHRMHQAATVVFFLGAVILTVVGLVEMEIDKEKRVVLGLGVLIILDATLNFAKVVYRVSHVKKIVKKIKKGFKLEISMEDYSGNFLDRALDTFATITNEAGMNTDLPSGYEYTKDQPGGPPQSGSYQSYDSGQYPQQGYDQYGGPPQGGYDQFGPGGMAPPAPPPMDQQGSYDNQQYRYSDRSDASG
jgi:hypothetical protein